VESTAVAAQLTPITDLELAILRANPKIPLRASVHVVAIDTGPGPGWAYLHVTCVSEYPYLLRDYAGAWHLLNPNDRPSGVKNVCGLCRRRLDEAPPPK